MTYRCPYCQQKFLNPDRLRAHLDYVTDAQRCPDGTAMCTNPDPNWLYRL